LKLNKFLLYCVSLPLIAYLLAGEPASYSSGQTAAPGSAAGQSARESAYRASNIGVALLEQFKYNEAADSFRRALQLDPNLAVARINLAIALYNIPDVEAAFREAKVAAQLLPDAPQCAYMLGLIARTQNRTEDAIAAFQRVLRIDPQDVGANVNLGQLNLEQRKYQDAAAVLRKAMATEPYNITAAYNLGIALLRGGEREEGQRVMQKFQALRQSGYGTAIGQKYLEQGHYAEAISSTGAESDLVDASTPDVTYVDATSALLPQSAPGKPADASPIFGRTFKAGEIDDAVKRNIAAAMGGSVLLFDYDGDCDLGLFVVSPTEQRLYRKDGGKFVDVTASSGLASVPTGSIGIGAVAGDYDNDGKPDLFVLRYGGCSLYHNDGNGKFSDVTAAAGIPAYPYLALSAAFVDVDHDGDLDLFIAGFADLNKPPPGDPGRTLIFPDDFAGAPNLLLRNDGKGKFTDITAQAKVAAPGGAGHAVAVVPTDYDNHRDIDLFVLNYGAAPTLFSNQRDGSFKDFAPEVGLGRAARFTCAAAGDVNKDGYTDFFFGRADGPGVFAMSDGHTHFISSDAPAGTTGATAAQFLDYDNDGLLDLVVFANGKLHIYRNIGGGKWAEVSDKAVVRDLFGDGEPGPVRSFASGDIDGDGATDLVARLPSGALKIARNNAGGGNHSVRVKLAGKVGNRSGIGSKIEVRAGSLWQKLETYSASPAPAPAHIIFGLGRRAAPDGIRVLWPSGIVQAELELTASTAANKSCSAVAVTELDRKPSSCPYLYAWNGERFEFVTDFMGGGEMGYWEAPGERNVPDPDEYVRILGRQLKARDGRYELRVTNELEEVLYVDKLQLIAVTHPADTEVYPNEGMVDPPRAYKLFATRGAHPPVSAVDDHGNDVLARIAKLDRTYPDDFKLDRIRGYAAEHTLTLDLGASGKKRTLLLLTGWTDYAFSSDNVAASQSGAKMVSPSVQVKDRSGQWQTVINDIGIPVGRPQTVTVDLTGKFLSDSAEVRIVTNMRIYWDQILVDTSDGDSPVKLDRLPMLNADLRWRGFSAEMSPDGREPYGCDYTRVSALSPWKTAPGRYTREGDVRDLLARSDDMFVISQPGDEIALVFDASKLPPLPAGWKRTFLLYADGFSKEMDVNSASPDQVAPLPYHGMKEYPYPLPGSYPMDRAHRAYMDRYNTRIVARPLPNIDALLGASHQR
jgi:tetratricopeptide (TPR) repeat protein